MFGVPLVLPQFQVIASILCLLMTILVWVGSTFFVIALRLSLQSPTSSRKSSLNNPLRQRFFILIMLLSLSKPLYIPFVLIVIVFTKSLVLTPHNKMGSLSKNIVNSLISLAHYSLRCMSHLIFGLTPSWLRLISKIGSHLLSLVVLFPFIVSYPHHPFSPLILEFLDVLLLSKITLLPSLNSPLVLLKECLFATLRHKRATGCTFLTPIVIWLLSMLSSMRTLPSSLFPLFLRLLLLNLLYVASLHWWSLLIPVLQFLLLHTLSPLLLLLFPRFSPSHLL